MLIGHKLTFGRQSGQWLGLPACAVTGNAINGGFFVLSPVCIDRIETDQTSWENEPLSTLAADGQLIAYEHTGFWQPMDTLREKNLLEELWQSGKAPWKVW